MAEDKTMYAWSNIKHVGEDGKQQLIKPGEEVSQSKLGYEDDAWEELVEGGAVRPKPWPKDLDPANPNALSPNEHRLQQLREQREEVEQEMAGVGGSSTQDDVAAEKEKAATPPPASGGTAP